MHDRRKKLETRSRILSFLEENRTASVPALSGLWGLTRADIRYHINNLLQEGMIEQIPPLRKVQLPRGRPIHHYRLRPGSGDENYLELCANLINIVNNECQSISGDGLFIFLANYMAPKPLPLQSLTQRMNRIVAWLNERGYHSHWEAAAEGPQIKFFHCPYASLLTAHPDLCQMDRLILENLSHIGAQQTSRISPHLDYPRACVFKLDNISGP